MESDRPCTNVRASSSARASPARLRSLCEHQQIHRLALRPHVVPRKFERARGRTSTCSANIACSRPCSASVPGSLIRLRDARAQLGEPRRRAAPASASRSSTASLRGQRLQQRRHFVGRAAARAAGRRTTVRCRGRRARAARRDTQLRRRRPPARCSISASVVSSHARKSALPVAWAISALNDCARRIDAAAQRIVLRLAGGAIRLRRRARRADRMPRPTRRSGPARGAPWPA